MKSPENMVREDYIQRVIETRCPHLCKQKTPGLSDLPPEVVQAVAETLADHLALVCHQLNEEKKVNASLRKAQEHNETLIARLQQGNEAEFIECHRCKADIEGYGQVSGVFAMLDGGGVGVVYLCQECFDKADTRVCPDCKTTVDSIVIENTGQCPECRFVEQENTGSSWS
jgi:hypothetical protein